MTPTPSSVLEQVLLLPAEQRVQLAERLLESLNTPMEPAIEAAWAAEAETRRKAVLSGEAGALSMEEVVSRLRARHER